MKALISELHALIDTELAAEPRLRVQSPIHQSPIHQSPIQWSPNDWASTPSRDLGDVAIPCFKLSKALGLKPADLARELAEKISKKLAAPADSVRYVSKVQAVGPYLNAHFAAPALFELMRSQTNFGSSKQGQGKTISIDFSSPNVAKEFALHHLRSTAIGQSLARLGRFHGYTVQAINYLGDWGTSFGKLIVGLRRFGRESELESGGLSYMLDLYVRFNQAEKEDPALTLEARAAFKKLEEGDAESRRIWLLFRDQSIREYKSLYARLGIEFDTFDGESLYEGKLDGVVEEITQKIGTRVSEGALVCDLPGHQIPILLKKDDGASLYITRDVAAIEDRYQRFHFALNWYVVAVQQKLHFQQLFDLVKALGKSYAGRSEHIWFGMLSFGSKTMKSREGNVIFLKDVLDEAKSRAQKIIQEKNPNLKNAELVAEQIGRGAIVFADLSQNRTHDVKFDWDKALSFEGDTSPFIQYSHARCISLAARVKSHVESLPREKVSLASEILEHPAVRQLLGDLAYFEIYVQKAFDNRDPSQVAISLLNIAKSLSQLYHQIRFLDEKSRSKLETLLALSDLTRQTLARGLNLLGIEAPDEM